MLALVFPSLACCCMRQLLWQSCKGAWFIVLWQSKKF